MGECELAQNIIERIDRKLAEGALAVPGPVRAFGGFRRDRSACAGCDEEILPGEAELQVFDAVGGAHLFHARCGHYAACQLAGYTYSRDGREILH